MTRAGELKLKLVNHGDTARPDATGGTQPCLEWPQPRGGEGGKEVKGRKEKGEEAVSQTNVYFRRKTIHPNAENHQYAYTTTHDITTTTHYS